MRVMGVKGLTLYHLKSHLQKFRLGKQPHKEFNDHTKDALDMQRNSASSSGIMSRTINDRNVQITEALRMQKEVQRRLHEQLEVQKHLQMRIEAQGKYMQSILERAYQTLSVEAAMTATGSYNKDLQNEASMELGAMAFDDFFPSNEALCLGKRRPHPYSYSNGKSPLLCSEENSKPMLSVMNGGVEMESMADAYDAKPLMLSVDGSGEKYDGSLERDGPATVRMSPMIGGGGLGQPRDLSYA